jgi:4-amino-4-deoxy-L-arabinose transferase-like glycosyltransferase
VMIWAVARWRIDGWRFFRHMLENDLIGVSLNVLDGHSGGVLFYINVLQKNQYDWLAAGLVACLLLPRSWSGLRSQMLDNTHSDSLKVLVAIWAAVVLLVPTAMQTKLPWYVNSFYPVFALGVGWIIVRALSHQAFGAGRRATVCVVVAAAFCVAEYRLFWYSYHMRDLAGHVQGMLLADSHTVSGRRVFSTGWNNADRFVLMAVHADAEVASGVDDFIAKSESGDYLVALPTDLEHPALVPVRRNAGHVLYQRRD